MEKVLMDGNILGIDIRRSDVCAVFVGAYGSDPRIEAHASIPLENRDCWECVADALEALKRHVDISNAVCVAALPDDWVSYRVLKMPFTDRRKIEKVIAFELEPLLPFSLDEVIIDFVVGPAASENGSGADVLAAVTQKARIKDYVDRFADLGLDPAVITPRGYAAAAVLSTYKASGLVVDTDEKGGTVSAVYEGLPLFIRSFEIKPGTNDDVNLQKIGSHVRHTLIACREQWTGNGMPDRVYLTGNDEAMPALTGMIEEGVALPASPMNLTEDPDMLAMGRPDPQWKASRMDVALCLALLRRTDSPFLNFRKDEFAVTGKWRQFGDIFAGTAVLALLVLVLWMGGFFYSLYHTGQAVAEVDARITAIFQESFPNIQRIVDPVAQMRNQIKTLKENSGLPEDMGRNVYCIDILNEISRLIPQELDVVVSRFVTGPDDVVISGHTDAFNTVDSIKNRLGQSEFFGGIEIESANMDRVDNRVRFKLQVTLL